MASSYRFLSHQHPIIGDLLFLVSENKIDCVYKLYLTLFSSIHAHTLTLFQLL